MSLLTFGLKDGSNIHKLVYKSATYLHNKLKYLEYFYMNHRKKSGKN